MKARTLILAASLAAAMSAGAQTSKGINPAYMNTAVKPGNDFYEYAIGGWRKAHPLDAEHARNGSFIDLDELNQKRIFDLIQEYSSKPQAKGSLGQKIGSLYNLAMDSVRRNREAAEPLNIVRHRAGLPGVSGLSQEAMREKIIHERRIELAFEGHRWFDMIRLQHGDYAVKFLKSIGKSRVTKERLLFPIPPEP